MRDELRAARRRQIAMLPEEEQKTQTSEAVTRIVDEDSSFFNSSLVAFLGICRLRVDNVARGYVSAAGARHLGVRACRVAENGAAGPSSPEGRASAVNPKACP